MSAGFAGQLGFKSESTWGTAVTVDQFLPFLSEGIKQDIARLESKGIRAGRRTTARWKAGAKTCGGPIEAELPNQPLATLLKHMFGAVSTTGTNPYTHTATPGDLNDDSLTIQVGRPALDGTVHPFTYDGCKIREWEITAEVGEIATLTLDITAESETTATALASASYAAGGTVFVFTEAALTIAGAAVETVKSISLKGVNGLADDRHRLGSSTVKEQLENGEREYTGEITADFESLTAYNRFVNGTEAALVLTFTSGSDTLTITCNVRFDGETPAVGGMEMLEQPLQFKCLHATADASAITAVLVNTEASAA